MDISYQAYEDWKNLYLLSGNTQAELLYDSPDLAKAIEQKAQQNCSLLIKQLQESDAPPNIIKTLQDVSQNLTSYVNENNSSSNDWNDNIFNPLMSVLKSIPQPPT